MGPTTLIQSKSLSTFQLCAEKWTSHTALSKAKPDSVNWSAENSVPPLLSTKSTTSTNKIWLRLLRLLRLTITNELKKSGNTGAVESWVLNLKLKLTRLPGFKPRLRVKKLKLWNKCDDDFFCEVLFFQ